jgi:uncharacterized oligopeptide transporter (OPT) family protein
MQRLGRWTAHEQAEMVEDPAAEHEQVKMWMWAPGLLAVIICICVVLGVQYEMPVGMSLLSVFLAFFFSFLAIQCTGVTDITPLTAASKASQVILGGATKGEHWGVEHAQRLNLLGGALANMGANQSTDLTMDFRTGFLLRTPPIQQWLAQGVGTLVAVFLAPLMFRLFMTAYPCVIDLELADQCSFSAPSVQAWRAVAVAVTDPTFPIPKSSGIFSIIFSIIGALMVLLRHFVWTGRLEWVRAYHPNMMCVSLAFVLPQTYCKFLPNHMLSTKGFLLMLDRRYRYVHGSDHSTLLGEEKRKDIRYLLLCHRCRSHRWRRYWWRCQCCFASCRRFWREIWLACRMPQGRVLIVAIGV